MANQRARCSPGWPGGKSAKIEGVLFTPRSSSGISGSASASQYATPIIGDILTPSRFHVGASCWQKPQLALQMLIIQSEGCAPQKLVGAIRSESPVLTCSR
eukprot:scaffold135228_cov35-Tisochrysis_lutea.AAC.2